MVTPAETKLQFKQKLTGSASEMLKKLKELHNELKSMEQDTIDTNSFSAVKKELVDTAIVNHKDKGVRIYAACCIADLLRLYAPDAPYNKTNLKTIFRLFVNELRHIATPENTYYNQHFYLLESLSVVKSIVLITDLPNADEITTDLFRNIFDDVRPQQAKNVHICMSELLEHVIMETSSLPQEIVDIILSQFLHKHKLDNPAAYRLACDLGNHCADKLQRYVFQYFSDIISTAGSGELSAKELSDFKTVHQLVVELNRAAPVLLLNVVPQLEEELKLSDVNVRSLAVSSLGQMFAEKTSQLASQYESTWKAWLLRRNDKVPSVRIIWLESLVNLIKAQPSLAKDLNEGLAERFLDSEEKVRSVACRIIGELDYETSLHHVQKDTLVQVGHRCRDKKKSVIKEAITSLSVLFNQAYPEIENGTQASLSQFAWMPSAIFHALYVLDPEIQTYVENAVYTTILPPHGTVAARAQRLIVTFAMLDDKGRTGLLSIFRRGVDSRAAMNTIMRLLKMQADAAGKPEVEAIEKKLSDFFKVFSEQFPDPVKASQLLHKYAKVHDEKFRQSITDCMDSTLPVREIRKAGKETLSRLENIAPATVELFSVIIQRICLTVLNKEVVSELIRNLGGVTENRQESGELLRSISLVYPSIFEDHLGEMISLLRDREATGASDTLHTLAGFAKQFARSLPADSQSKEVIQSFLEAGTILQATHATIVLASIKDNEDMCQEIAQTAVDRLEDTSPHLLRDLTILSQLALYTPQVFETVSESVTKFVVKTLLMTNVPEEESMYDATVDWVEASELNEYTLSKIMGLKVLVNRAIILASDQVSAQEAARPLFKLLWTLITEDGELVKEKNSSNVLKSHLRLSAARFVVKLCNMRPVYERMVSVFDFCRLALIIQDPVFRVRHGLAKRIMKYIRKKELHARHLAVLFLAAHEPELEWKKIIRDFLAQTSRGQEGGNKLMHNELTLARLIHLLANHPDFATRLPEDDATGPHEAHSINDLNLSAKYIEFYLETMANSENISLIYYIAALLKTARFSNLHEPNENLYALSDLAQYLIQEKSRSHNWTLTSHPGQVVLPRELYSLTASDVSAEISKKSYLSAGWVYAREHRGKAERKPRPAQERKIGQAAKRRSRSASVSGDDEDVSEPGTPAPARATKRAKKARTERAPETPTRRMASRVAKAKATAYRDIDSSEGEEDEEDEILESDEDN
ncbi:MAG: armadillo-type protein [Podila humilis]|nr:MAG: armadillo-type protein [Podila humilis]